MRRSLTVILSGVLLVATVGPVAGATVLRSWSAALGTGGTNGRIVIQALGDGTGLLAFAVRNVPARLAYKIQVRAGTCARLGTIVAQPTAVKSSATGRIIVTNGLSVPGMNSIWSIARKGPMVIRIISTKRTLCGNLNFAAATRIQIPAMSINLAVIPGPATYPKCNVAMYMKLLWQPREPGVAFLYAHARRGMFLPMLNASKVNDGAGMIGMVVKVWTSDSKLHTYTIDSVRRHVTTLQDSVGVTTERLWLQTSEGPNYTYPKLIIEGSRVSTVAATFAASHPAARPVNC